MLPSIRQIFFNLKLSLSLLAIGITLLGLQLYNITQYSDRLAALKNQHVIIEKTISTDLSDISMANIIVSGNISELALAVKLSSREAIFDTFSSSAQEQELLSRSLTSASEAFQDAALFWIQSMANNKEGMRERMMAARSAYLIEIDRMIDYQIHLINQSISVAKTTVSVIFVFGMFTFLYYLFRLNQIYNDINKACSVDLDGTKPEVKTQEIDFIVKRLARKGPSTASNPTLLNPLSGLTNEKGMISVYNIKRATKSSNSLFITLFEIDQHENMLKALSKEDVGALYRKIGEILSMYEQPQDVIAHLDDNRFVFIMSRSSKDIALSEAEKIVASVHESMFNTDQGTIKVSMSAGFMLKAPNKSIEESIADASKLVDISKENGGNRVAQLRDRTDSYR